MVGGSVASSVHGRSRPTMDVDIVADLQADQIDEFPALLAGEFYADPVLIREALGYGRAFRLIHLPATFKIDIVPLKKDAYSRASFGRRRFDLK